MAPIRETPVCQAEKANVVVKIAEKTYYAPGSVREWCQYRPPVRLRLRVISSRYPFVTTEEVLTSGH